MPEAYREDSCLEFLIGPDNKLYCQPIEDQVPIVGDWISVYSTVTHTWVHVNVPGSRFA